MRLSKMLFLVVLYSLVFQPGFSDTSELSLKQLQEFNRRKLIVESKSEFVGTINLQYGLMTGGEIKYWQAYEGFRKIREPEFFEIAGYEFEAARAKEYHNTSNILTWGGGIGFIAGLSGFLWSLYPGHENENWAWDFGTISIILGSISTVPFFIGAFRTNYATAAVAYSVAEAYNQNLAQEMGFREDE